MVVRQYCAYGCKQLTAGSTFLPGHDQKLRTAIENAAGGILKLKDLVEANYGPIVPERGKKVCPECGHVFQGNGWDGIDAHWRAKHEDVMPYEQAWPLLKEGHYPKTD